MWCDDEDVTSPVEVKTLVSDVLGKIFTPKMIAGIGWRGLIQDTYKSSTCLLRNVKFIKLVTACCQRFFLMFSVLLRKYLLLLNSKMLLFQTFAMIHYFPLQIETIRFLLWLLPGCMQ